MAEPVTGLERAVMEALLAGADPRLDVLRDQLGAVTVVAREFTGVGFFTEYSVPVSIARLTEPLRHAVWLLANPGISLPAGKLDRDNVLTVREDLSDHVS